MYPRLLAKSEWLVACVLPRVCVFAVLALGDAIHKQLLVYASALWYRSWTIKVECPSLER